MFKRVLNLLIIAYFKSILCVVSSRSDLNYQRVQEKGIRGAGKFLRQNMLLYSISCQLRRASKGNFESTH